MATQLHDDTDQQAPERSAGQPGRTRRRSGAWTFLGVVAGLMALGLAALWLLAQLMPSLPNPFATERVDRTGPAVLQALEDLSEHRAATGHFQVIIDVEDDASFLPSSLRGERTLFVAAGTVDAVVDFSDLGGDAVQVSGDRRRAEIQLPSPQLSVPRIDPERSYVYAHQRGLIDRIGEFFSDTPGNEGELYVLAQQRLMAAAEETELEAAAERNTRAMLETLLGSLGFTEVEVSFDR